MFLLKQRFLDSVSLMLLIVQHPIFKNICRNFSVATKTIPNQSQYYLREDKLINIKNPISYNRPRGPTDKASDYESGDSRFESWRGLSFIFLSCNVIKPSALKVLLKKGYKRSSLTT